MRILKQLKPLMVVMAGMSVLVLIVGTRTGFTTPKSNTPAIPLILKYSTYGPKTADFNIGNTWILREIEKRSEGRLKIEYYFSSALVPERQMLTGIKSGVADIGAITESYYPGRIPLCTVTSLPMIGNFCYSTAMAWKYLVEMPEIKAEFDEYNMRYLSPAASVSSVIWAKFPISSIANLKGKKIRAVGNFAILMKELGAAPVTVTSPEVYESVQKGIVDGICHSTNAGINFRYYEVATNFYRFPFGGVCSFLAINKDSWKKIPADIQQMFIDLHDDAVLRQCEETAERSEKKLAELVSIGKVKYITATDQDIAFVKELVKEKVWKDWVKRMNERKLAGQKVLDSWLKFNGQYEVPRPKY